VFNRDHATAAAEADALRQLRWMASAMFLLAFALWILLHFGFAARLARLAAGVRAFGEGERDQPASIGGGDEVAELSGAFAAMAEKLKSREAEQQRLETEILEASERERRRIGHELHDGIGQELTAALLATNGLSARLQSAAPTLAPHAEALAEQLTRTMVEVRSLSRGLAPVPLWEGGLADALQALADAASDHSGVRCVFDSSDHFVIRDPTIAGHLYRIAQEAVNNALKHASPREIRIGLERRGATLHLEIEDDGEGMPESAAPKKGLGFRTMRHRAAALQGRLVFEPAPAGGTRVSVQIPWPS
jgi:signal transduction histidine kinase